MAYDPKHVYKIRYSVEKWGKPAELVTPVRVHPGVVENRGSSHGYCDVLFVASIINDPDFGTAESVLLMDSETGAKPSRELLLLVKDAIEHHLEHHCG